VNESRKHVVVKLHWKEKTDEEKWKARKGELQFINHSDRYVVNVEKLMDTGLFDSIDVVAHYTTSELLDSIRKNKDYIGTQKKTT